MSLFGCPAFVDNDWPNSKFHANDQPKIMPGCDDKSVYTIQLFSNLKTLSTGTAQIPFDESSVPNLQNTQSNSSVKEPDWHEKIGTGFVTKMKMNPRPA